jgi:hypothetical protein
MLWGIVILLVIGWLILYSLGRAMDITEDAWKNRKVKDPCPYCGSMAHRKSYHVPKR